MYMKQALELAKTNHGEIPVGAVIVKDKKVISLGQNHKEQNNDVTQHAEIVAIRVNSDLLDDKGRLLLHKAKLIGYSHGEYLGLGRQLGKFGFSVAKKK